MPHRMRRCDSYADECILPYRVNLTQSRERDCFFRHNESTEIKKLPLSKLAPYLTGSGTNSAEQEEEKNYFRFMLTHCSLRDL